MRAVAMNKFIPGIGISDFRAFREAGCGYVDKSWLISTQVHQYHWHLDS